MADQPVDPYVVAEAILAAVVAGFADATPPLPDRRIITAGVLPAWDGPQVTVSLQRIYPGLVGAEQGQAVPWQHGILTGQFLAQLIRKAQGTLANAPRRQLPSAANIASDGQQYMTDMRALAAALQKAKREGAIATGQGKVKLGPIQALEQQGELLGMSATVEVLLV